MSRRLPAITVIAGLALGLLTTTPASGVEPGMPGSGASATAAVSPSQGVVTAAGDGATTAPGRIGPRWRACSDEPELQCGTVTVPRNWQRPNGRTIDLQVRRIKAEPQPGRAAKGSILMNFGGPGEDSSALGTIFEDSPLRRHFDLVSWDPRGVGSPPRLADCTWPQLGSWRPVTGPFSWIGVAGQTIATRAAANQPCAAANRSVSGLTSTNQTVRDLDAIRVALGDRRLTYLGYSYGTRIGRLYAQRYPQLIRAMVLDGVTGPANTTDAYLASSRSGGTAAWRWVRDRLPPSIRQLWGPLNATLATRSAPDVDRWSLWWSIKQSLRSSRAVAIAASSICGSAVEVGLTVPPECSPIGPALGLPAAIPVVDCTDMTGRPDAERIGQSLDRRSIAGPAALNVVDYTTMCAGMPPSVDPIPAPRRVTTATPVLLINGIADPSTPLVSARATQRFLPGSRLVRVDTSVHGLFQFQRSPCVQRIAERYLLQRSLPAPGTRCPTPPPRVP